MTHFMISMTLQPISLRLHKGNHDSDRVTGSTLTRTYAHKLITYVTVANHNWAFVCSFLTPYVSALLLYCRHVVGIYSNGRHLHSCTVAWLVRLTCTVTV
jgi:hypothetical protein